MEKPTGADRLIVALDVPTADEAIAVVEKLGDRARIFKVGWEMFITGEWRKVVDALAQKTFFVDLKLPGDIPNTISRVIKACVNLPVKFITLSETVKAPTLAAAREARGKSEWPKFLVVTLFSSLDQDEFERAYDQPADRMDDFIVEKSKAMLDAGCDGLIASGPQIALVRERFPHTLIVSPGIRPKDAPTHDHKRVTTPTDALRMGADYLVIGRPITSTPHPAKAADKIIAEIEAFDGRGGGASDAPSGIEMCARPRD